MNKIYLAGSFHGFRDRIIDALPEYDFSDPRKNRQSCVAKNVIDDMTQAEECPILMAIFPKSKDKGTMTYAEIGASLVSGNMQLIVDENQEKDPLLEHIAAFKADSIQAGIDYLNNNNINATKQEPLPKKELGRLNNIYLCGETGYGIERIIDIAQQAGSQKNFILKSNNPDEDMRNFNDYDLIAVHFPKHVPRDRHACFFMGMAYTTNTPVLLIEENSPWKYPPLMGLARRHTNLLGALDYFLSVEDQEISKEAKNMYQFFTDFRS